MAYIFINTRYTGSSDWINLYYNTNTCTYQAWIGNTLVFESKYRSKVVAFREAIPYR